MFNLEIFVKELKVYQGYLHTLTKSLRLHVTNLEIKHTQNIRPRVHLA